MHNLARIRYVTEHYRDLQGLMNVPISFWLFGWVALDLGWIRLPGLLSNGWLLLVVSFVALLIMWEIIGRLYDRAFGQVTPDARELQWSKRTYALYFATIMVASIAPDYLSWLSAAGAFILHMVRPYGSAWSGFGGGDGKIRTSSPSWW